MQAKVRFGLKRRQLMITFSHNHCGPRLGDDLIDYYPVEEDQEVVVREWQSWLCWGDVNDRLTNSRPARPPIGF